jgi:hypothetical protein
MPIAPSGGRHLIYCGPWHLPGTVSRYLVNPRQLLAARNSRNQTETIPEKDRIRFGIFQ